MNKKLKCEKSKCFDATENENMTISKRRFLDFIKRSKESSNTNMYITIGLTSNFFFGYE